MVTREQALIYFRQECIKFGAPESEAEAKLQENNFQFSCFTASNNSLGSGITVIHKVTGNVYNFGSNPVFSHLTEADSKEAFETAVNGIRANVARLADFSPKPITTIKGEG